MNTPKKTQLHPLLTNTRELISEISALEADNQRNERSLRKDITNRDMLEYELGILELRLRNLNRNQKQSNLRQS